MNPEQSLPPVPPLTPQEEALLREMAQADDAVRRCQQSPEHERIAKMIAARLQAKREEPSQTGGQKDF